MKKNSNFISGKQSAVEFSMRMQFRNSKGDLLAESCSVSKFAWEMEDIKNEVKKFRAEIEKQTEELSHEWIASDVIVTMVM